MERVFTQATQRWAVGDVRDWPLQTWKMIESSTGMSMDDFSTLAEQAARAAVQRRGPGRPRKDEAYAR